MKRFRTPFQQQMERFLRGDFPVNKDQWRWRNSDLQDAVTYLNELIDSDALRGAEERRAARQVRNSLMRVIEWRSRKRATVATG